MSVALVTKGVVSPEPSTYISITTPISVATKPTKIAATVRVVK